MSQASSSRIRSSSGSIGLEPDLHAGPAVVVRAREVDVGIRVEDQLLLLAVDPDAEPSAVASRAAQANSFPRTRNAVRPSPDSSTSGNDSAISRRCPSRPRRHDSRPPPRGDRRGSTAGVDRAVPRVSAWNRADRSASRSSCPSGRSCSSRSRSGSWPRSPRSVDTFLVVFIGIFLAFVFEYPVRFVMEKTRLSRGLAATVTVLGTALAVVALLLLLLVPLVGSVRDFLQDLPELVESLRASDELSSWLGDSGAAGNVQNGAEEISRSVPDAISAVLGIAGSFFTVFLAGFTILFICLFLLTDVGNLQRSLTSVLMPGEDARWLNVWERVTETISRWAIGVIVIATIAGTIQGTTAWLLGLELRDRARGHRGPSRHDPEHRRDHRRVRPRARRSGRRRGSRRRSSCSSSSSPTSSSRTTSSRRRSRGRRSSCRPSSSSSR